MADPTERFFPGIELNCTVLRRFDYNIDCTVRFNYNCKSHRPGTFYSLQLRSPGKSKSDLTGLGGSLVQPQPLVAAAKEGVALSRLAARNAGLPGCAGRLLEGDAQRLGSHGRGSCILRLVPAK